MSATRKDINIVLMPGPEGSWDWKLNNLRSDMTMQEGNSPNKGEALRDAKQAAAWAVCEVIVRELR